MSPRSSQEYLLHPPFDSQHRQCKRHDGGKGDHHMPDTPSSVRRRRETGIGKLAGQGDKGGHQ